MQGTLTQADQIYCGYSIKKRKSFKYFSVFCGVFISIIFIITILTYFFGSKYDYFSNNVYYMLALDSVEAYKKALEVQEKIQDAGGSGYIFSDNGVFYIIGFSYQKREDAQNVAQKLKKYFPNCEILEIETTNIKRKVEREIKREKILFNSYKILTNIKGIVRDLYDHTLNNISYSFVYKELEKIKIKIEDTLKESNKIKNNEINNAIKLSLQLSLTLINKTKSNLYDGGDVIQNLRMLLVNLQFEDVSFKKMLNNI